MRATSTNLRRRKVIGKTHPHIRYSGYIYYPIKSSTEYSNTEVQITATSPFSLRVGSAEELWVKSFELGSLGLGSLKLSSIVEQYMYKLISRRENRQFKKCRAYKEYIKDSLLNIDSCQRFMSNLYEFYPDSSDSADWNLSSILNFAPLNQVTYIKDWAEQLLKARG